MSIVSWSSEDVCCFCFPLVNVRVRKPSGLVGELCAEVGFNTVEPLGEVGVTRYGVITGVAGRVGMRMLKRDGDGESVDDPCSGDLRRRKDGRLSSPPMCDGLTFDGDTARIEGADGGERPSLEWIDEPGDEGTFSVTCCRLPSRAIRSGRARPCCLSSSQSVCDARRSMISRLESESELFSRPEKLGEMGGDRVRGLRERGVRVLMDDAICCCCSGSARSTRVLFAV